jgi:NCAIR mutase (PurE)-related protein
MNDQRQATMIDLDRERRCGFPEVVYGPGKSRETIAAIAHELLERGQPVLVTRVTSEQAESVAALVAGTRYNAVARTLRVDAKPQAAVASRRRGKVTVITAGTSDMPVAEEARETLDWMGVDVNLVADVGVAGRAAERSWRLRPLPCVRSTHERGVRREPRRVGAAADDAQ